MEAAAKRSDRVGSQDQPPRPTPQALGGGPIAFLRFAAANRMLSFKYVLLIGRWAWLKLRWRGRLRSDGLFFVCSKVTFEIGPNAVVKLGRWSWLGDGCKVRAHEGVVSIGDRTVLGQECTISAFQHVSIASQCILADRVMLIDFDHASNDVERPIREQGIYKRDVRVGNNVWVGYGACLLRGVTVGDNSIIGSLAVVTRDVDENAVVGGSPARVLRMREQPEALRWS